MTYPAPCAWFTFAIRLSPRFADAIQSPLLPPSIVYLSCRFQKSLPFRGENHWIF